MTVSTSWHFFKTSPPRNFFWRAKKKGTFSSINGACDHFYQTWRPRMNLNLPTMFIMILMRILAFPNTKRNYFRTRRSRACVAVVGLNMTIAILLAEFIQCMRLFGHEGDDTSTPIPQVQDTHAIVVSAATDLLRTSRSWLPLRPLLASIGERSNQLIGKVLWSRTQQCAAHLLMNTTYGVGGLQKFSHHVVFSHSCERWSIFVSFDVFDFILCLRLLYLSPFWTKTACSLGTTQVIPDISGH